MSSQQHPSPRASPGTGPAADANADPGAVLRAARRAAGWSQRRLAAALGCSESLLSQMESGQRRLSEAWAECIERALALEPGRLVERVRWDRTPEPIRQEVARTRRDRQRIVESIRRAISGSGRSTGDDRAGEKTERAGPDPVGRLRRLIEQTASNIGRPQRMGRPVPIINRVTAGGPAEFTDLDYPVSVADEYAPAPELAFGGAFAARVSGDSMAPDYRDGEIVIFSPDLPVSDGSDCFARLEPDHEITFKRIYFEDAGETIVLRPVNPAYEPRRVPREQVAGLYAAAYVLRRVQPDQSSQADAARRAGASDQPRR